MSGRSCCGPAAARHRRATASTTRANGSTSVSRGGCRHGHCDTGHCSRVRALRNRLREATRRRSRTRTRQHLRTDVAAAPAIQVWIDTPRRAKTGGRTYAPSSARAYVFIIRASVKSKYPQEELSYASGLRKPVPCRSRTPLRPTRRRQDGAAAHPVDRLPAAATPPPSRTRVRARDGLASL